MKISLQIILADARSPGRGLPPQPFDRHISGELPNLDNIIQESESQYGDSARADTIQLPRAARAASARGRSLCRARGQLSLLKVWASRSHRLELGLWPRSGHPGLTTQGAPIAQVSGFWPRGSLSGVRKLSPRSDPTSQSGLLLGAPGPRAQASRVPRKLPPPPGPQSGPAPPVGVSASVNLPARPRQGPPFLIAAPKSHPTFAGSLACGSVLPPIPRTGGMRPSRALGRGLFGREARPYSSEQCTGTPPSRALEQGQAPAGWGWGGDPVSEGSWTLPEAGQGPHPPTPNGSSGFVPNPYIAQCPV